MPTVLRSIHLPTRMDEQLNGVSFLLNRPKAEAARWCISHGLAMLTERVRERGVNAVAEELRTGMGEEIDHRNAEAIRRLIVDAQRAAAE